MKSLKELNDLWIEKKMKEGSSFEKADEWVAGYFNFMYALCGHDEEATVEALNSEWKE